LNEYSVSRNKGTIEQIVKVTRPNFKDEQFQNYMKYVINGELTFERARELKRIIEKLKRNEVDEDTLETISRHSFQLEELKHAINNASPKNKEKILELSKAIVNEKDIEKVAEFQKEILSLKEKETQAIGAEQKQILYKHLYKGLRYAALMLNLVALERVYAEELSRVQKYSPNRGSFWQDDVVKTAIPEDLSAMVREKIENIADYRASKILPFTLINAHRMVKTAQFKKSIEHILLTCAHEAFNIPEEIEILIGVDTSGSMHSMLNDSLSIVEVASFLGALITSSHKKTTVCAVADFCKKVHLQKDYNLFKMAEAVSHTDVGHGTMLGEIMKEYHGQKFLLLLTDSVTADDLESNWLHAKKPSGAKLIVWQLQAYQTKLSNHPSVIYFAGFSDRLLELLKIIIEDKGTQLEEIESIVL
jgi:60 kDa SS-A/Ro ribonucleoprotein